MTNQQEHLETLQEIRSLMERSSRFLSLSGLSGVFAGIFALAGAVAAYLYFDISITGNYLLYSVRSDGRINMDFYTFFFADAGSVLVLSLIFSFVFSFRKAKREGLKIWDKTAKRLAVNLFLPLIAGGFFCLVMLYHGYIGLVAPATLLFYGLALLNASKYTFNDLRFLGLSQIALGLISALFIGYGLLFWALGFGVLHIIYGTAMYFKYEK
ncbi:MAG: hypothetical protein HY958_11215 [Bacteroidia bacterium]|nr:hypothetical protein [Bacteroidia bacterium]